ncbi:MAG: Asp-tRNA(Asn)/Glu-tRNA(Gln) amidotransferase GatCAB subunit C, partial [Acidobacteria bacterium]
MPVAFTRADVEAVARLANIELTEEEVRVFTRQLADILEYARQLQEIDTTGVAP